jgi:GMP synthase (glutamine-hydrolysing)
MRVLTFRHLSVEHPGLIEPALESRGLRIEPVDLYAGAPLPPDWQESAAFLFMGGPMSANDNFDYLKQELRVIECAVGAGKPVLGVCLGSQLLAKALGARVYRNAVKEIGWAPVRWSQEARADTLFTGLADEDTVFHWHGETFDLPENAVRLASSAACRNQAFRYGEACYGLQFHLEVTPEMIAAWCAEDANQGDLSELAAPPDPYAHGARLQELAATVFGRWADLVLRAAA